MLYKDLSNLCKEIIRNSKDKLFLPILFPIKNQSELLLRYKPLSYGRSYFIFYFLTIFLKYLAKWVMIFISSPFHKKITFKQKNNNTLIVSHLVKMPNKNERVKDYYFGDEFLNSKPSIIVLKVFIDHTKKFNNSFLEDGSLVIGNSLPLMENIKIFNNSIKLFVSSFLNFNKLTPLRFHFLMALDYLSPSYRRNKVITFYIGKILHLNKIENIFFTLEGHAWEKLIVQMAKNVDSKIKTFGYAHGVILKEQDPVAWNPQYSPDIFLTSGKLSYERLLQKGIPENQLFNIGRLYQPEKLKNILFPKETNLLLTGCFDSILFVFNGEDYEVNFGLRIVESLSSIYTSTRFIIRLHPISSKRRKCKNKIKALLKVNSNVFISDSSIKDDSSRSIFVFYRGSSAVLEAISFGAYPIFFGSEIEKNIDILSDFANDFSNHFIKNFVKKGHLLYEKERLSDWLELTQLCARVFENFDNSYDFLHHKIKKIRL